MEVSGNFKICPLCLQGRTTVPIVEKEGGFQKGSGRLQKKNISCSLPRFKQCSVKPRRQLVGIQITLARFINSSTTSQFTTFIVAPCISMIQSLLYTNLCTYIYIYIYIINH
jgi:hypothetical protein